MNIDAVGIGTATRRHVSSGLEITERKVKLKTLPPLKAQSTGNQVGVTQW